jgi:hypothetical protein
MEILLMKIYYLNDLSFHMYGKTTKTHSDIVIEKIRVHFGTIPIVITVSFLSSSDKSECIIIQEISL